MKDICVSSVFYLVMYASFCFADVHFATMERNLINNSVLFLRVNDGQKHPIGHTKCQ